MEPQPERLDATGLSLVRQILAAPRTVPGLAATIEELRTLFPEVPDRLSADQVYGAFTDQAGRELGALLEAATESSLTRALEVVRGLRTLAALSEADLVPLASPSADALVFPTGDSLAGCLAEIGRIGARVKAVHDQEAAAAVQDVLGGVAGRRFLTFEENQRFTDALVGVLDAIGHGVTCPKAGCCGIGRPRWVEAARVDSGVFVVEHAAGDRFKRHGSSSTFPGLTVVPLARRKPGRKPRGAVE